MTLSDPDAPQRPAKTPASRKRRRAAAAAAAVALFLCLAIAVFLTNRIGASRIEIAIDLLSEPDSAPILVIVDGDGEARSREPMARVADEFARHIGSLEFKPTGRRNLKSRGILVGFTCTAAGLDEIENLPKGWRRADEWIVGAPGAQPFKWVGLSDDAALILRKWPFGGIASVT
ncbi:MAG: hypothetical protein NTW86_04395, partial [Candidatus Sumerlaeota bacterium]|nr:hypothetical protein [Candidatus Sumerlaeota bacterium]